jgi:hypothetical protein
MPAHLVAQQQIPDSAEDTFDPGHDDDDGGVTRRVTRRPAR